MVCVCAWSHPLSLFVLGPLLLYSEAGYLLLLLRLLLHQLMLVLLLSTLGWRGEGEGVNPGRVCVCAVFILYGRYD